MIAADWRVARLALQIIAEQGPGNALAHEEAAEDVALASSVGYLSG